MPRMSLSRAVFTAACCLTLTLPTNVRAAEPEDEGGDPGGAVTEHLSERASEHITKAIRAFNNAQYSNAEEEFKRAAFFAPKWRPLHFNMAVVAEAQGKLGVAINEYKQFKPNATSDEEMVVDQRIFELDDRRRKIAAGYKQQIATGAIALTIGVLALGGGAAMLAIAIQKTGKIDDRNDTKMALTNPPFTDAEIAARTATLDADIDKLTKDRATLRTGAYIAIVAGVIIAAYSAIPLSKSIRSKRQLDGIALGPTRLKWNGGLGATLKF